ncbi:GSCFA domain-containing protein [Aeromonas sp. 75A]
MFKLLNVSRVEVFQKIKDAKCFIYTLGLGAAFFSKSTGELLVPDSDWVGTRALIEHGEFKTTSVSDNYRNILEIISLIRKVNIGAQIIITLSPVPLLATFERHSAVIADCLSKSVLRVAVNEVMNDKIDAVYYWPSFEAVRWLGPHIGKCYGSDDGVSRHINESIISDIISVFVDSVTVRDC